MKIVAAAALILLLCGFTSRVDAQWLNHPTPGIPRDAAGKPNLSALAPQTSDGKPDFSGVWAMAAGPSLYYIPGDLKPTAIKPFGQELVKQRTETFQRDDQGLVEGNLVGRKLPAGK